MKRHVLLALLLLPFALTARADRMPRPVDMPPAFKAECASCHVAFPPSLLSADSWRQVMGRLDKHYGDNASLDDATRRSIEAFLVKNAGSTWKVGAGPSQADAPPVGGSERVLRARGAVNVGAGGTASGELPRITTSPWFVRKHHEVPRAVWRDARLKSPANCAACHSRAADDSYREREIVMPDGRRWED